MRTLLRQQSVELFDSSMHVTGGHGHHSSVGMTGGVDGLISAGPRISPASGGDQGPDSDGQSDAASGNVSLTRASSLRQRERERRKEEREQAKALRNTLLALRPDMQRSSDLDQQPVDSMVINFCKDVSPESLRLTRALEMRILADVLMAYTRVRALNWFSDLFRRAGTGSKAPPLFLLRLVASDVFGGLQTWIVSHSALTGSADISTTGTAVGEGFPMTGLPTSMSLPNVLGASPSMGFGVVAGTPSGLCLLYTSDAADE